MKAAVKQGKLEEVRKHLRKGYNVDEEDERGLTALLFAAIYGYFEIASLLIEEGARINHQNKNGNTALHCATVNNHLSIVSLLIENGADLNIKNNDGETALIRSAFYGHTLITSLLLHKGADVTLRDKYGKTALKIARQDYESDCVEILENYEHFHQFRGTWLSFSTSLSSFQEDQNQESKQIPIQSQSQVQSPSLMKMMDSSDLVRYVTEYM